MKPVAITKHISVTRDDGKTLHWHWSTRHLRWTRSKMGPVSLKSHPDGVTAAPGIIEIGQETAQALGILPGSVHPSQTPYQFFADIVEAAAHEPVTLTKVACAIEAAK